MATEHDDDQNPDNLAGLRKKAKLADDALTENQQLKRELMFARAGIDTDTKLGKMLMAVWEGDDLNALKEEALELGLIKQPGEVTPETKNDDAGQADFRRTVSGGAPAGGIDNPTPDPTQSALDAFQQDVKNGVRREDAAVKAIEKVMAAAASGDKRAIFNPTQWANQAAAESSSRA